MRVGDLVQHAWSGSRDYYGIGMVVGFCSDDKCRAAGRVDRHWILHFPNAAAALHPHGQFIHPITPTTGNAWMWEAINADR